MRAKVLEKIWNLENNFEKSISNSTLVSVSYNGIESLNAPEYLEYLVVQDVIFPLKLLAIS